jgi:hypothetical protein
VVVKRTAAVPAGLVLGASSADEARRAGATGAPDERRYMER